MMEGPERMIFIIGGGGFVGSAFARLCQAAGREHRVIEKAQYADFVGQSCDILVNANGNSSKPLAVKEPMTEFDASVRSVRASLVDFKFKTYVHLSSCDVYPDCASPETTREDGPIDLAKQSPYGFHKFIAEQCVRHAAPRWIVLRMGGFVGPGMKKNAIFDICFGQKLWLDPKSELQFMPTDELARIALELADRGVCGETFNVCGKGLVRLADAVAWSGKAVPVNPGAPLVRYEVGTEKVGRLVQLPSSVQAVRDFVTKACAGVADVQVMGRPAGAPTA
jgi:nucleoside-diphosphate-sugar epimerase